MARSRLRDWELERGKVGRDVLVPAPLGLCVGDEREGGREERVEEIRGKVGDDVLSRGCDRFPRV